MTTPKVIHSDVLFSFGKYKGKPVEDIMKSDQSYLLWLHESGNANLADDVLKAVTDWIMRNPHEAEKTAKAAHRARDEKASLRGLHDKTKVTTDETDQDWRVHEVKSKPEGPKPESWGTW